MSEFLFVLGAPKCGTTSMSRWLSQHNLIQDSVSKEPKFFTSDYDPRLFHEHKLKEYANGKPKYFLYHNPMLLMPSFVPYRIQFHLESSRKRAKFIICLRNPIERMYSHWNMDKKIAIGRTYPNFSQAIKRNLEHINHDDFQFEGDLPFNRFGGLLRITYIEYCMYARQIKRYIDLFGENSVFVTTTNTMKDSAESLTNLIDDFLELDHIKYDTGPYNVGSYDEFLNMDNIIKRHPIVKETMKFLIPEVEYLSKLLKFDFIDLWGLKYER